MIRKSHQEQAEKDQSNEIDDLKMREQIQMYRIKISNNPPKITSNSISTHKRSTVRNSL
jgi:hypothetical protein